MKSKITKEVPVLVRNENKYIGTSDVPYLNTFHRSELHTYVNAYNFSELWLIKLS